MRIIQVIDVTHIFRKEVFFYSLFDIHFKRPMRLSYMIYFLITIILWTLPLTWLLWPLNPYTLVLVAGTPFFIANLLSKPIWGNKSFLSWAKTQIQFLLEDKKYYDGKNSKDIRTFKVEHEYIVSRKDDFKKLFQETYLGKEG